MRYLEFRYVAIPNLAKTENSQNVFANELQANGMYRFYLAFMNSELDYFKFYKTLPEKEAFCFIGQQIPIYFWTFYFKNN